MFPDEKRMCHKTGFATSCRALNLSGACQGRWAKIEGTDKNTGKPADRWGCVDDFTHLLMIETNAHLDALRTEQNITRNEMAKMQGATSAVLTNAAAHIDRAISCIAEIAQAAQRAELEAPAQPPMLEHRPQ